SNNTLVPSLLKNFPDKPVIAAGGIANAKGIASMLSLGAVGVSIGTLFIASDEAPVSKEYKEAIISSGREDIVMTSRLSGAPVSIINTPFYKGLKKADEERKNTKGIDSTAESKMETMNKGIRMLEKSIKPGNYNNLWVAGKSVETINLIKPVAKIIETLKDEFQNV
ncbi:MAG: nitronate monooxygenase, partial [Bacteroidales bacterium]|nr:nitronate monooxygenase [Bacteroidales bacterium]